MTARTEIRGYVPGCLGRIVELHADYYSRTAGFGAFFEAKVAAEMAAFLQGFETGRDGLWVAWSDDRVEGSVAIQAPKDGRDQAQLRWFILSQKLRGQGVGNALLGSAVDHCRAHDLRKVELWTFAGLDAARHLYEKHGFRLVEENEGEQWGGRVLEQRFLLEL